MFRELARARGGGGGGSSSSGGGTSQVDIMCPLTEKKAWAHPFDDTVYCRGTSPKSPTCCNYVQDLGVRDTVGAIQPAACYASLSDPFRVLLKDFGCAACKIEQDFIISSNRTVGTTVTDVKEYWLCEDYAKRLYSRG